MRVQISDPARLQDLLDFLRRAECVAEQARRDEADVYVPRASSETQARRELELYLQTWEAMNPDALTQIIEHESSASGDRKTVGRTPERLQGPRDKGAGDRKSVV